MTAPTTGAPAAIALRAEHLGKRYGRRRALHDVSFAAGAGELTAVVGPNGAGKTTLLAILAGVLAPDLGTVSVSARGVGWVPQHAALYAKLSVAENLRLFARLERVPDVDAAVSRMLDQTGLRERADEPVGRLSGGNRQRVNIAAGLLGDPPVLLLDEPSSSLDPRQREVLWEFAGALAARGGTTILYSSHDIGEVERHADRVLVLAGGELVFDGRPAALRARAPHAADLEAAFVSFLAEHDG